MFIDLLDVLRCPQAHEETWLVGTFDVMDGRDIVRGTLGCPICRAEYAVRDRVVHFGGPVAPGAAEAAPAAPGADDALRLGAMLGLVGGGGIVVLGGGWARLAPALRSLVEELQVVLVNAPADVPLGGGISALAVHEALPFAAGSLRGVALDATLATPAALAGAVRALRPRGRLVVPVAVPLPADVVELARDEEARVAERQGGPPTPPIGLLRARRGR